VPLIPAVEGFGRSRQHADVLVAEPSGTQARSAMARTKPFRFPRTARLLRHADFERVYKQGRRHFSASMTVFYCPCAENATAQKGAAESVGLRIGFTVGRALGGAVQRNRIKRRLREAVRMSLPATCASADVVINPKKCVLDMEFSKIQVEISRAFAIIEQKLPCKESTKTTPGATSQDESRS
jgi:ribonuclease P protein component